MYDIPCERAQDRVPPRRRLVQAGLAALLMLGVAAIAPGSPLAWLAALGVYTITLVHDAPDPLPTVLAALVLAVPLGVGMIIGATGDIAGFVGYTTIVGAWLFTLPGSGHSRIAAAAIIAAACLLALWI